MPGVNQHLHMHQCTHQHAFTPILHPSLTLHPALMGTQDSNFSTDAPRGGAGPSFAPITVFHRATQKSFRSTKRGRWGALHVCIAWRIYYQQQMKKIQQKHNSHRELTPECSAVSPSDSVQQKESDQPSCVHPNLNCPHSGRAAENVKHFNRNHPSDLYPSAPACCSHATKRETLEPPSNLHWKETPDERGTNRSHHSDTAKDLPLRDKSCDQAPELEGGRGLSFGRKRLLECDDIIEFKRAKQETTDDHLDSSKAVRADPSPFCTPQKHPSTHIVPVQHINMSKLSGLYPNSSRCYFTRAPGGFLSYPGAEMHPYQPASLEPMWGLRKRMDLHSRQNALQDFASSSCRAIGIPLAAQRQKEAFQGFFTPPLYLPLTLRQQETVYLRGREFLR